MTSSAAPVEKDFSIAVMGRTLEHLGVQMYKRRDAALAELVANAWDAGATEVVITLPDPRTYNREQDEIIVRDDGAGMTDESLQSDYLVIGRNRRAAGQAEIGGRKPMGRKGIGKLAGFGLAQRMKVDTWRDGSNTTVTLDVDLLKTPAGDVRTLTLPGSVRTIPNADDHGTCITLSNLKHASALDPELLRHNLARRFSRSVRGRMLILVNGVAINDAPVNLSHREPEQGEIEEELPDGNRITWWAGFSDKTLSTEMQGFVVIVRGKTAQAPPFFFGVESRASGQHGTKYLTGVIEADFLDDGADDDSDHISTDRQEVDWSDESVSALRQWGETVVRRLLREHSSRKGDQAKKRVQDNPNLAKRLDALDRKSKEQARRFIGALGASNTDPERLEALADTILRAYEYRQFHDYIEQLDLVIEDPEKFEQTIDLLRGWRVLESRAVLEVVKGRLDIVDKFHSMIVDDAPETAPRVGRDNMHDLIADFPWLINPEWQVLAEEKRITSQLREWGFADADPDDRTRYDFLALRGEGRLVVIEIKRSGHSVSIDDLHQIDRYAEKLRQAETGEVSMAVITGSGYTLSGTARKGWQDRDDIELLTWAEIHARAKSFYEHYRAVLEGDVDDSGFGRKASEIARTRNVLTSGAYRGPTERSVGLGNQDRDYLADER
ncbi:ATP-binding protein [Actinoplanes sp. NEAU-A12]|uniref:ATP-binding protein n=1 Tax=Actinoplanes sandaracinus TaxID=3045177 RepID=A0ABT6WHM7_9ACTN|nr:ATP-binding protein [Actinoplanes sandaracinus]MDI6099239.1 ATP-binding protein [Actinoplanes sandaracinus]